MVSIMAQIFVSHGSWLFQCVLCSSFPGSPLLASFSLLGGSLRPPDCSCLPGKVYGTKVQLVHLLPVAQPSFSERLSPLLLTGHALNANLA